MQTFTPYSNFIQSPPTLKNEFVEDQFLQDYLATNLPDYVLEEITPNLDEFGKLVATDCIVWAREAEKNPPQLTQFDAWGKRVDHIQVSQGWLNLERVAAEEGLVAIGYERQFGEYSRLYQFTKLYLYTASSAIYTCPLAMTDGAARLIELHGDDYLKGEIYSGLISRNPENFKTSGQWMTERTGGSDVSRSMTIAIAQKNGFSLHGHKWFTSAITAHMAFTLASIEHSKEGERAPLSLFYLPIRDESGRLNGIEVEALKDKLGTKALPTAQLLLKGANAIMVGQANKGVRTISTLFNITRIYNTISAVSYMRRAYALCKAYSTEREAFGQSIGNHLLYQKNLRELEITYQSNALLAFFLVRLLGKEECNTSTEENRGVLRLLTPVAKLYSAKQAISVASEHIEMFGGLGYLEDSGIPSMLRDAQVLSIWEGTTNVLSLDMLRAIDKENGLNAFRFFAERAIQERKGASDQQWQIIEERYAVFNSYFEHTKNGQHLLATSRDLAFYLAELTIAVLWASFLEENCDNLNYSRSLDYWLYYRINPSTLNSAEWLDVVPKTA